MRLFRSPLVLMATLALVAGPAAAVTAQSPSSSIPPTVPFTGRIHFGECTGGSTVVVDGVTQTRGDLCQTPVLEMSAPLQNRAKLRYRNAATACRRPGRTSSTASAGSALDTIG